MQALELLVNAVVTRDNESPLHPSTIRCYRLISTLEQRGSSLLRRLRESRAAARFAAELRALDDARLRDIGIERFEIGVLFERCLASTSRTTPVKTPHLLTIRVARLERVRAAVANDKDADSAA